MDLQEEISVISNLLKRKYLPGTLSDYDEAFTTDEIVKWVSGVIPVKPLIDEDAAGLADDRHIVFDALKDAGFIYDLVEDEGFRWLFKKNEEF